MGTHIPLSEKGVGGRREMLEAAREGGSVAPAS